MTLQTRLAAQLVHSDGCKNQTHKINSAGHVGRAGGEGAADPEKSDFHQAATPGGEAAEGGAVEAAEEEVAVARSLQEEPKLK